MATDQKTEGWNAYINILNTKSGADFVEALLASNENGQQYTTAWPLQHLTPLGQAGFKKIVDVHKKKSRASVVVGDVKFICAVSNEDFTFWTFSGELGGIQKPVLMCSSANTCSVIALFKTRGGNVNHVANVVELLKKGNA